MSEYPVILRGSPGTEGWKAPGPEHRGRTLASQVSLYWHAAGDASAHGDRFGLMAAIVARGRLMLHGLLVVPDDLGTRDPVALDGIRVWAKAHPLDTAMGRMSWRVVTLGEFFDPRATRASAPWAFVPNAYAGCGPVIGADLGRTIGLVSEYCAPRVGRHEGAWTCWLPGWGRNPDGEGWKARSPNRPPMRLRSRRVGWSLEFSPCEKGHGKWTSEGPWRGAFPDVLTGAYALDADRAAGFVEHARHFGVIADALPVAVEVNVEGASRIVAAVRSVQALALALDEEAGRWFTTPQDRSEWTARFPLAYAQSPAGLSDHLLRQSRVAPPLGRFPLRPEEDAAWWEAFHGGWNAADPAFLSRPFEAVALDVTSAYPLTAHLLGWWEIMTADGLSRRSVLGELRALCRRAAKDPSAVLDPAVWARFGLTVCEVAPSGEPFPVALDDPKRPDGRTETVPVIARGRTMFYGWPDVVATAILSARVPRIVRATRLVPEGHQDGLRRRVPVYPGLVLDADDDPVLGLVRRRRKAKAASNTVLAAELHAMTNSLVSGNPSRLDDVRVKRGGAWRTEEKAGPWTFAPIAVSVTAGARLLLAVVDRMARDLGSRVAYRDTDSSILPASPGGGTVSLADGTTVHELSDAEVDALLAAFAPLSPDPTWPVWKREPGPGDAPMRCVVFGPKRHAEYRGTDDAPELVDWTEATLGGRYADPPTMQGRCAEGGRVWSKVTVEREIRHAAAKVRAEGTGEHVCPEPVPWDDPDREVSAFPALRRLQVISPALLATLPASLGAHMGSRYLEASFPIEPGSSFVAIDPGGALNDWQDLVWRLRRSGERARGTTTGTDYGARRLEALSERASAYGYAPKREPVETVTVTPLSVVYRGRVSPVLDASDDGMAGDLRRFRVRYEDGHGLGPGQADALVALARSMPSRRFAERSRSTPVVARRIARGELPGAGTTRRLLRELRRNGTAWIVPTARVCGLDGCDHPVSGRRVWCTCCRAHAEAGRKRRQRAAQSLEPGRTGPGE